SQNELRVQSENVAYSTVFELGVSLDNTDLIAAIQFDITYDVSAFNLLTEHSLTSREADHTITTNPLSEGVLRVVIYSMSNNALEETSGVLANLEFESKTDPGEFTFALSNVVFSSSSGATIAAAKNDGQITVLGPKMGVSNSQLKFGDVLLSSNQTRSLLIKNEGNEALVISSVNEVLPFSIQESFPISIAPNETIDLTVLLDTSTKLNELKELSFVNNDVDAVRNIQKVELSATVFAINTIGIGNNSAAKDAEVEIPVSFENMEEFIAFQFDLLIPEGLEFVSNSIVHQSSRFDDHDIAVNLINVNTLRFIGYSPSNKSFVGNSGELFSFKLKPIVNAGYFPLDVSNAVITNSTQENILSNAYNGYFQIKTPNLSINPIDINFENMPSTEPRQKSLTLNNIGDASLVIDEVVFDATEITLDIQLPLTIVGGTSQDIKLTYTPSVTGEFSETISFKNNGLNEESFITARGSVFSPNYVLVESKEVIVNETNVLQILLKNNDVARALQFDIELPTGFELETNNIETASRADGYEVVASKIEGSKYRVILYSMTNKTLTKGSLSILSFPVFISSNVSVGNYNFNFSNVIITNTENIDISSLALESGLLTVSGTSLGFEGQELEQSIQLYPNPVKDILSIKSKAIVISKVAIYSVLGKKIKEVKSNFESIGIYNLSNGLYIIRIFSDKGSITKRIIKR
ncbi:MAG: hypothetical protein ACI8RY_001828, partial [Urechidicola sp.]